MHVPVSLAFTIGRVVRLAVGVGAIFVLLGPLLQAEADGQLPPRPTPAVTPAPAPISVGLIDLTVEVVLPEYRTVIQWVDGLGSWHDVDGWRGGFDEIVDGVGRKAWAVEATNFGTGPFRWLVYREPEGVVLGASEEFYLPAEAGQVVTATVGIAE